MCALRRIVARPHSDPAALSRPSPDVEAGLPDRGLHLHIDAVDVGVSRALAAPLDEAGDGGLGTFENRLDAAVCSVAHPARHTEGPRLLRARATEPDTLDATGDEDPPSYDLGCRIAQT